MDKPDLFKPQIPLLPTNGAPFAAYLFLWFFPNVTSINLSRTKWSDYTTASTNFPLVEILFWQNCLSTSTIFLSDLDASVNLIELYLDNLTICLPLQYQGTQQWYSDNTPGAYLIALFQNLNNCTRLRKFLCANCRLQ